MAYAILWSFRPRPEGETAFRESYGASGAWAELFRLDETYLGTDLLRASDGRYLTIDRWASESAYRAFLDRHASAYAALDARCAALTLEESWLGGFEI